MKMQFFKLGRGGKPVKCSFQEWSDIIEAKKDILHKNTIGTNRIRLIFMGDGHTSAPFQIEIRRIFKDEFYNFLTYKEAKRQYKELIKELKNERATF